jgi:hypothetical protein
VDKEFPPLTSNDAAPVREKIDETDTFWVQVASKGKVSKLKSGEDDRCILKR